MSDGEWFGEPHTLTVRSVTLPEGKWDDGSLEYDLEHPPSCKEGEPCYPGVVEYLCDVAHNERECGLAFSLRYSGTPVEKPGTYRIQGWGTKTYYWDAGYEYDAGVAVMDSTNVHERPSVQSCAQVEGGAA